MDQMDDIQSTVSKVRELAKQLPREPKQLPLWPQKARGAPAAVLRSALFGMVKRGRRKAVDQEVLASWKGDRIVYTGWQLDQPDFDCWLQILHFAKDQTLGEVVDFTGREFLTAMGKDPTGNNHRWLRGSIGRLQACGVSIQLANGLEYQGPLVEKFVQDKATRHYAVVINLDLAQLFDEAFVRLDQNKRKLLRSDLSRWLQGYVQSHRATAKAPHRIRVERLQQLSGSRIKIRWKFKQALQRALVELQEAGVIKGFDFPPRGLVVEWVRPEQVRKGVE